MPLLTQGCLESSRISFQGIITTVKFALRSFSILPPNKIWILFIFAACLIGLRLTFSYPPIFKFSTKLTESKTYQLVWHSHYTNTNPVPVSGCLYQITVPECNDGQSRCQELLNQEFSPKPTCFTEDSEHNRQAIFKYENIAPGETVSIEYRANVRVTNLTRHVTRLILPSESAPQPIVTDLDKKLALFGKYQISEERSDWYKLIHIYDAVRSLDFRLSEKPRSLERVLDTRQAQCADAARLFVALCQRQRIPARQISGLYLHPEAPSNTDAHSWAEAKLPGLGWIPFDPTMGRFHDSRATGLAQLDNRYICLWQGPKPELWYQWLGAPGEVRTEFHHYLLCTDYTDHEDSPTLNYVRFYSALLMQAGRYKELHPYRSIHRRHTADQALLRNARAALRDDNYHETEYRLAHSSRNEEQKRILKDLFAETKQTRGLLRVLRSLTVQGIERDDIICALTVCADASDWRSMRHIARAALTVYPDDLDILVAYAQAKFRLGNLGGAMNVIRRIRAISNDGYADAILGDLYLDIYQYAKARHCWQSALDRGLRPEEAEYYKSLLQQTKEL